MAAVLVYITATSVEEATKIGRHLVEKDLAACVNIIPGMTSIYRWQGAIESGQEVVLIAKGRRDAVPALTQSVKEMHSYECPCVVAVPIVDGSSEFLDFLRGVK